jgi:hypothetical protein
MKRMDKRRTKIDSRIRNLNFQIIMSIAKDFTY